MKKIISILLLISSWALALSVIPKAKLDRQMILTDTNQSLYLLITFDVAKMKKELKRPNLNLSLVIDRSGSMSDKGKLLYAKKASKRVVNKLKPTDILSIVEYDDKITVLWPASPVLSHKMVNDMIDTLSPRGGTNLTGGMMKGADEVKKNYSTKKINRVILLSDGMANTGITKQEDINKIVSEYKQNGIAISTMGLGLNYNEDLMQMVAEHGGGKYYYIESPSQINSIFAEEMNTIFTTVAKNVVLKFKMGDFVKNIDVFGFESETKNNSIDIKMDNFYSQEKRTVLIKLDVKTKKVGKISLGDLDFSYLDVTKNQKAGIKFNIEVEVTNSKKLVNSSLDKKVKSEAVMMETEREHRKFTKMYENGDKKKAKAGIVKLTEKISITNKTLKSVVLEKKIEALKMEKEEIEEAEKSFANRSKYLKMSKMRSYNNLKGVKTKTMQRVGDKGYDVKQLQIKLKNKNLYKGKVDGKYSEELKESVQKYQEQNKIKSDGVAGPRTLKGLKLY